MKETQIEKFYKSIYKKIDTIIENADDIYINSLIGYLNILIEKIKETKGV